MLLLLVKTLAPVIEKLGVPFRLTLAIFKLLLLLEFDLSLDFAEKIVIIRVVENHTLCRSLASLFVQESLQVGERNTLGSLDRVLLRGVGVAGTCSKASTNGKQFNRAFLF